MVLGQTAVVNRTKTFQVSIIKHVSILMYIHAYFV